MQKILILSYFFPPCNLTASQRTFFWAKYLNEFGYFPIVITRNWDTTIKSPKDVLKSSGKEVIHEVYSTHEVYFLPYKSSVRDKLFIRFGHSPLRVLSQFFTIMEQILRNFFYSIIPYKNLYKFTLRYLQSHNEINKVVITANPFEIFYFGYLLKKKLNIKWLADYRDDWNTSELNPKKGLIEKFISLIEKRSEKKWVESSSLFTSVSPYYVNKISISIR